MSRYLVARDAAATTVVAFVIVTAVVGAGALVAGSQNATAAHGGEANYTVVLPESTDHLPGDQNAEGASIRHSASGGGAFDSVAPDGFETFQRLELRSDAVDFSGCGTENTAVFGIDRGNDNPGTRVDESLLDHMKNSNFNENSLEVVFYGDSDLGGQPTDLNPEDAIVALQGSGSTGGPCYTMPAEPGWYQISGTLEGTNGAGETVTITAVSHYFPICEGCDDEATAQEKLGPSPSSDGGDAAATPTPAAASKETSDVTTATEEPTTATTSATAQPDGGDGEQPTPDDTNAAGGETGGTTPPSSGSGSSDGAATDGSANGPGTPTPGEGPGFTAVTALLALLGAALLGVRRR